MATKKETGIKVNSLIDIKSKYCTNPELSDKFIDDVLNVTGYEIDDEGYIVDSQDDPLNPEYVQCKGRILRITNSGILHTTDMIFDPYNNIIIMEELFKKYLAESHTEIVSTQILSKDPNSKIKADAYGYITILYANGAIIQTGLHYKDTTKYLDAFMRLEARVDGVVMKDLKPYDDYEAEYFNKYKTMSPSAIMNKTEKKK